MGIGIWHKFALTGGGATALDGIATASIADSDVCHVYAGGKYYFMVFYADATDAENSPYVIRPDDFSVAGVWKMGGSPYGDIQVQPEIVAGLPIQGGITGGDISKASATTLTITPITCLDSGLTTKLYTSANTTFAVPHTGSIAANTIYHIYLVKLIAGGTFEFRTYTTEAAVASDAAVDKYRWVGFWLTDGSSNLCNWRMDDGKIFLISRYTHSANMPTGYTAVNVGTVFPISRIRDVGVQLTGASGTAWNAISLDGANAWAGSATLYANASGCPPASGFYTYYSSTGNGLYFTSFSLRR